jgi:hypothetical protein
MKGRGTHFMHDLLGMMFGPVHCAPDVLLARAVMLRMDVRMALPV